MAQTNYTAEVNKELEKLKSLLMFIREANIDTANAYKEQLDHAQNLLAIHKQDRGTQLIIEARAQKDLNKAEKERIKILKELNSTLDTRSKSRLNDLKEEYKLKSDLIEKNKQSKLEISNDNYKKQLDKIAKNKEKDIESLEKTNSLRKELENLKQRNRLELERLKINERIKKQKNKDITDKIKTGNKFLDDFISQFKNEDISNIKKQTKDKNINTELLDRTLKAKEDEINYFENLNDKEKGFYKEYHLQNIEMLDRNEDIFKKSIDKNSESIQHSSDRLKNLNINIKRAVDIFKLACVALKKFIQIIKESHETMLNAASYTGRTGKDNSQNNTLYAEQFYNQWNVSWQRLKASFGNLFNTALAGIAKIGSVWANLRTLYIENIINPMMNFFAYGQVDSMKDTSEELFSEFTHLSSGLDNANKALNNFANSVSNGQGMISQNNMTNTASEIAVNIARDKYLNNGYSSDQILTMLGSALSGSGAEALGIHTDNATLAGWAAMTQGKDIVNVDITDEKRQQMILDMINEQYKEMAKNGKGSLQSMIKEWKTLGNIMEQTKNQTLAFDEVINLAAFDPEIPDYVSEYNAIGNLTEGIDWANGKLITFGSNGEIVYRDLNEWLLEAGNSIDQVTSGLDKNGNTVMMTNDVYRSFKSEVDSLVDVTGSGMEGLTKMLINQDEAYIKNNENINSLITLIDTMKEKLLEKLGIDIDTFDAETGLGKVSMIVEGIKTKFEELKKLVKDTWNEVKTFISGGAENVANSFNSEGGLLNRLGNSVFVGGLINGITPGDSDSVKLGKYIGEGIVSAGTSIGDWAYEQWYGHPKDFSQWDHTSDTSSNYTEEKWYNKLVQDLTQFSFIDAPLWGMQNYDTSAFHASGGISTKAHLAHISEMNKAEAIIPLESSIGINALSEAMNKAGAEGLSQGNTYNIHLHLDGINIADNDSQWSEVANRIAEYMQININRQGEYNYGLV